MFLTSKPALSNYKRQEPAMSWQAIQSTRFTDLVDDPAKRAARVRTGEDVLVHEEAPDKVFKLPRGAYAGDLEDEDAVIIKEVVNLAQELGVPTDTDMLEYQR